MSIETLFQFQGLVFRNSCFLMCLMKRSISVAKNQTAGGLSGEEHPHLNYIKN